jgi:hypothetical protein
MDGGELINHGDGDSILSAPVSEPFWDWNSASALKCHIDLTELIFEFS